jgi:hypothetical protein
MKKIIFNDIRIGQSFFFGESEYVKVENDKGLSLAGLRIFNLEEIVII